MRALFGLVPAASLLLAFAASAQAQWPSAGGVSYAPQYGGYSAGAAVSPRPYAFRDESPISINNAYLGYGNLVDSSGRPPAPGYVTRYGQAVNRGFAPGRGSIRWIRRRHGLRF